MKRIVFIIAFVIIASCNQKKKEKPSIKTQSYKTLGSIEKLNLKLDKLMSADAKIEILASGYEWSEGPLWLEKQQRLIWSDVPQNTIYTWKEGELDSIYLKPSGYTGEGPTTSREPGSNGLLLDNDGNLVLCQHGDRRIAKMNTSVEEPSISFTTLADNFEGKRLSSPNDAVFDNHGNLYFTDPPYGLQGLDDSEEKEIDFNGVYKLDTEGNLSVMVDSLTKPNGIAFNNDFTKCYVANSDPKKAFWAVYEMDSDKKFINGKIFFDATPLVPNKKGLPDGLKVDNSGNIFATGPGGVLVFSPEGEHLGTINTEQATANCAFNRNKSVLYITADSYILRLKLK